MPVKPYRIDSPKSSTATESTPMRKNFIEPSLDRRSNFRSPAITKPGTLTSSRATNIITRSRALAMSMPPRNDDSSRK